MIAHPNNTLIIRWLLGLVGVSFLGIAAFLGSSFSGELKELQKANQSSKERLGVVETMVDNIRDDVKEIKGDVKETQYQVQEIDTNINEIKQMIMEAELRRARESRNRGIQPRIPNDGS